MIKEAADTAYTEAQLIAYALEILRNTNEFESGIKRWNRLAAGARTWQTFKRILMQSTRNSYKFEDPPCVRPTSMPTPS